ncbi:MAG: sugar transferase [Candidatus Peribacteria bacterium]|nr:MAG: sugar transferase [Candidatus Peribacteria bacterium]
MNSIQNTLLHRGVIPKRKIILITNTPLKKIQYILKDIKASGIYTILGYIGESVGPKSLDPTLTYLGGKKEFHSLLRKGHCDEVLYIDSDFSKKALFDIWDLTRIYGVRYRYITNSFDITSSNSTISLINTIPVIELENTPLGIWGRVLKRGSDIAVSVILLLLLSPILIIIWAIIKFENPKAPAIYKNLRVGK